MTFGVFKGAHEDVPPGASPRRAYEGGSTISPVREGCPLTRVRIGGAAWQTLYVQHCRAGPPSPPKSARHEKKPRRVKRLPGLHFSYRG
jgi:hypothetical protein